ncbi:MAG TPA: tetratricopeptide repeat protein [Bacilli bacterium]|nr:tetratricopeptide repeat protein [Bacilli bacterium]
MGSLGQKIRQRRMEKGLTQSGLAEGLVSASAISQIESDKINPSYKLLCQLAERLEVPLDYFLSETEEYLEQSTSHKLAKTFISAKEYANAVPILEKLMASADGTILDVMKDLATCYLQLKNYEAAGELWEKVLNEALKEGHMPDYIMALKQLGLLFYKQNNISLAQHYWKKAYDASQQAEDIDSFLKADVSTNLAITYNDLGDFNLAAKLFQESQELLQDSINLHHLATIHFGLGLSYYGQKDFKLAEKHCEEAISLFTSLDQIRSAIRVRENYGIFRGDHGHPEEALETLLGCLQEYKDHHYQNALANTLTEIAKQLIRLQRYSEAARHLDEAFACCEPNSRDHAQCLYVRSLLRRVEEKFDDAIADAKQAMGIYFDIEAIQDYNKVTMHLSELYKQLGDYKSSTEILENSQKVLQVYLRERGLFL